MKENTSENSFMMFDKASLNKRKKLHIGVPNPTNLLLYIL